MTNRIDMVSLARSGEGTNEQGWALHAITNYSASYKYALRFPKYESYVVSPRFTNGCIVSLNVSSVSSTNRFRRLAFTPVRRGRLESDFTRLCDYSPTKNIFTNSIIVWPRERNVRQFKISYDSGGGRTGWGLRYVDAVFAPLSGFCITIK